MNCFIVSDDVDEFYGEYLISLQNAIDYIINQTNNIGCKCLEEFGRNPIENIRYRSGFSFPHELFKRNRSDTS